MNPIPTQIYTIPTPNPILLLMNPNPIPTQIYTIPTPNPIPLHMIPNPESNPYSYSDSSFDSDSGFGIAPGLIPSEMKGRLIPCQINHSKTWPSSILLKLYMLIHIQERNKVLCQIVEESVKYFSSYAPPKNWNFNQKIELDRYVASIFYQYLQKYLS